MGLRLSMNRAHEIPDLAEWHHPHEFNISDSSDSEPEREDYESEMDDIEYHPTYVESGSDDETEMYTITWYKNRPPVALEPVCGNNGRIFGGLNIPEEMLSLILSYVEADSLLNCRLVCRRWRSIVETDIWRFKLERRVFRTIQSALVEVNMPFPALYKIYKHNPFNRNLIKNSSGEEKLKHWEILKNGGDGWRIEKPPAGADTLPDDDEFITTSCFATSFYRCIKVQLIDLCAEGLAPIIMDEIRPTIYVSEWYAARFDCACTYTLYVVLLNKKQQKVHAFKETKRVEQWQGREWHKVEHEFKHYRKGVRYVKFFHSGCDCQFWKGHYGSKMSRACVKVIL